MPAAAATARELALAEEAPARLLALATALAVQAPEEAVALACSIMSHQEIGNGAVMSMWVFTLGDVHFPGQ